MTKKQKIKILQEAIVSLELKEEHCICLAVSWASNYEINSSEVFGIFPELLKHKPQKSFLKNVWFECNEKGVQKRISILNKVIKELRG